MIKTIEENLYNFLVEKLKGKNINVYRGVLPDNRYVDREKGNKTNNYFPFVLLRIVHFEQTREGINSYDAFLNVELWIGTKEIEYIQHLEIGDFLREEFLKTSTVNNKFAIDQSEPYTTDFYSEEKDPFFFSISRFKVLGCPEQSEVLINFLGGKDV